MIVVATYSIGSDHHNDVWQADSLEAVMAFIKKKSGKKDAVDITLRTIDMNSGMINYHVAISTKKNLDQMFSAGEFHYSELRRV